MGWHLDTIELVKWSCNYWLFVVLTYLLVVLNLLDSTFTCYKSQLLYIKHYCWAIRLVNGSWGIARMASMAYTTKTAFVATASFADKRCDDYNIIANISQLVAKYRKLICHHKLLYWITVNKSNTPPRGYQYTHFAKRAHKLAFYSLPTQ